VRTAVTTKAGEERRVDDAGVEGHAGQDDARAAAGIAGIVRLTMSRPRKPANRAASPIESSTITDEPRRNAVSISGEKPWVKSSRYPTTAKC
jgi:hypothetical protein